MANVRDIISNFRNECELQGPNRIRLLELSLAGGIAFAAPMMTGQEIDGSRYYNSAVYSRAIDIVSAVNELVVIDTQSVLELTRALWLERYGALNDPRPELHCSGITGKLKTTAFDLTTQYYRWVVRFVPVCRSMFIAE